MTRLLLERGCKGEDVIELQKELARLELLHSTEIDGDFGGMTKAAVQRFQESAGLSVDGIVGNQTWAKLLKTKGLVIASKLSSVETSWTLGNIDLLCEIIPGGNFTWADATKGGSRMPPDQETLESIIRIATLAQKARDFIGRPFTITSWYRDPDSNAAAGGVSNSRHINGDAIDFWIDGMMGREIYDLLDPWWEGGLGQYSHYPFLCHIDARDYRARWTN